MDPETLDNLMKGVSITLSGSALLWVGEYIGRIAEKYNRLQMQFQERFRENLSERIWESEFLPRLAQNIAVSKSTVDSYVGEDFDVSRIGYAFNPFGDFVPNYFKKHPSERKRLRKQLTSLVSEYSKK